MYKIGALIYCLLEGFLVAAYGWIALLWSSLGYFLGLFISAQMVLPIILGLPLAFSLVSKKQMRPKVFIILFRTPVIWVIQLYILGFILGRFFPTAANWIIGNQTLNIGMSFGLICILFSPLSKKVRGDFRIDFDKIYGRYYTDYEDYNDTRDYFKDRHDKKQLKQIEAAIKIGSNLYLHTTSGAVNILRFNLPDSRFRYMIFCTSAMVKACDGLITDPDLLAKDCLHFLSIYTTAKDNVNEFFTGFADGQDAETNGILYFNEFLITWSTYYENVGIGNKEDATSLVSSMIHSTESNEQIEQADQERLKELSYEIERFIPSMRRAFIDSLN
jgi:hypothetical protein